MGSRVLGTAAVMALAALYKVAYKRVATKCEPVMVSASTKAAHRPYIEEDIHAVLKHAISGGLIGIDKEVRKP